MTVKWKYDPANLTG